MDHQQLVKLLENRLGTVRKIMKIKKGFSTEEKYIVRTNSDIYLLRISPEKASERKKEEFETMKELFVKGVRCNKPIDFFLAKEAEISMSLFSFLPGKDAEENINGLAESVQFGIGLQAGNDLKKINSIESSTHTWKQRKLAKHANYLRHYSESGYRFTDDTKVLQFIELNSANITSGPDRLQHDDFHLGNIVIKNNQYAGILDFNRYDWGDPLHEFVKLEWFTWPVSREFSRGEVKGYFGKESITDAVCLSISVYIAMSIFSTLVWTMKFHPHTMPFIESRMHSILDHYEYFDRIRPEWAR